MKIFNVFNKLIARFKKKNKEVIVDEWDNNFGDHSTSSF